MKVNYGETGGVRRNTPSPISSHVRDRVYVYRIVNLSANAAPTSAEVKNVTYELKRLIRALLISAVEAISFVTGSRANLIWNGREFTGW